MPSACQKVIARSPNTAGPNQFHRLITRRPKTATPMIPMTPTLTPLFTHRAFIIQSSFIRKLLVDGLQTAPQMKNRIMLAREQRVDAHPRLFRKLLKTSAVHFMCDENLALFFRKFL